MANGFFLGGMAQGMESEAKQRLAERSQTEDTGLRSRALDIKERELRQGLASKEVERLDGLIANTMESVNGIVTEAVRVGKDPEQIRKAVQPLVDSAKMLASKAGRDPAALDARVNASLFQPTALQTAATAGAAEGTKNVANAKVIAAAEAGGMEGLGGPKDPKDKISAEGALRDDYQKTSKDFITMRDYKDRMDKAPDTGAGDIALVFSYMKILDPASTVREGEFATASNAAGVPSTVMAQWNRIVGGGRLDSKARTEIRESADKMWGTATARQNNVTKFFEQTAKRQGLNPKNVIVDVGTSPIAAATTGNGGPKTGTTFDDRFKGMPAPPKGFNIVQ